MGCLRASGLPCNQAGGSGVFAARPAAVPQGAQAARVAPVGPRQHGRAAAGCHQQGARQGLWAGRCAAGAGLGHGCDQDGVQDRRAGACGVGASGGLSGVVPGIT